MQTCRYLLTFLTSHLYLPSLLNLPCRCCPMMLKSLPCLFCLTCLTYLSHRYPNHLPSRQ
jgi:hypothetical protein